MPKLHRRMILLLATLLPVVGMLVWLNGSNSAEANAPTANLILNGDFAAGDANWSFEAGGGSAATLDTSTGAACVTITTDSANFWEIQMQQFNLNLAAADYVIQFDVKADPSRSFTFKTGQSVSPFGNYGSDSPTASAEWQTVTYTYTQTPADAAALFQFQLGAQGTGEICFDNVSVEEVVTPPENLIVNGDFAAGDADWALDVNGGSSAMATLDTSSGAACVSITDGSTEVWHIQLQQFNLNLGADNVYEFNFDVMASADRDFNYKTGQSVAPYGNYLFGTGSATAAWQTISQTYTQSADDAAALVQFQLGNGGTGDICFDNISLVLLEEAVEPPSDDAIIKNGDFAAGLDPWQLVLGGTAAATTSTDSGAMCVDITDASANQWELNITQGDISLLGDTDYSIEFMVMADADREFFFKTGATDFSNYTYQSAQATTEWSTVSVTYTQAATDTNAIFEFQLGARGTGVICIDDVAMTALGGPLDRDIAKNGAFDDGVSGWKPFFQNGASVEIDIEAGEMKYNVVQTGTNVFDAMLWQLNLPVVKDYQYSLRFDARAEIADGETRTIFAKVGQDPAPYATYGGGDIELTNAMQPFAIDFTMENPTDGCGKIEFHLSQTTGAVYLDNVQLLTNAPVNFDSGGSDEYTTPSTNDGKSLRVLAEEKGIVLGAAANTGTFLCNALHQKVLTTEFNAFTPANEMKMGTLVPFRGQYDWAASDAMVDFIEANDMEFHGHAFVWHSQMPAWADSYDYTRDEMIDIMYEHIDTVGGRYKGRIAVWDVVNEAIDDDRATPDDPFGSLTGVHGLRVTPWQANIGDDYIKLAFERARQVDPDAQLLYNDYVISQMGRSKADATFEFIKTWVMTDGVPIDGVGFQMHWDLLDPPNKQAVADNMARYAEIGVDVYITEIDVRIPNTMTRGTDALDLAATVYKEMLEACIDASNCTHFTTWAISDSDSWIPGFFNGYGRAQIFDENYEAKPAYFALSDCLESATLAVGLISAEITSPSSLTLATLFTTLLTVIGVRLRRRKS